MYDVVVIKVLFEGGMVGIVILCNVDDDINVVVMSEFDDDEFDDDEFDDDEFDDDD